MQELDGRRVLSGMPCVGIILSRIQLSYSHFQCFKNAIPEYRTARSLL